MTNRLRPNVGRRYARPFESTYALVRRCLVTNPGCSYATMDAFLRRTVPEAGSLSGRLAYLQGLPREHFDVGVSLPGETYKRQCPVCAQHLYHTELFALPWLSHCPIHHCELIEVCPACNSRWPPLQDLPDRSCPICGIPSLLQLPPANEPFDLQPIRDIVRFLAVNQPRMHLTGMLPDLASSFYFGWWDRVDVESPFYPSIQAHRNPIFDSHHLDQLHIRRRPVQHTRFKIKRSPTRPYVPEIFARHPASLELPKTADRCLRNDYRALKYILAWIYKQGHRHPVQIASYRYKQPMEFVDAPNFCPYCLAISLWFFHNARERYGKTYLCKNEYPFMEYGRFSGLFGACFPELHIFDKGDFTPDARFSSWLYRRGVELSFTLLLVSAFDWLQRVRRYRAKRLGDDTVFRDPNPYECTDHLYGLSIRDGDLCFYFSNQHPLEHVAPPKLDQIEAQCTDYMDHYREVMSNSCSFVQSVYPKHFTYEKFLGLHHHLQDHLRLIFNYRFPGNVPKNYSCLYLKDDVYPN